MNSSVHISRDQQTFNKRTYNRLFCREKSKFFVNGKGESIKKLHPLSKSHLVLLERGMVLRSNRRDKLLTSQYYKTKEQI